MRVKQRGNGCGVPETTAAEGPEFPDRSLTNKFARRQKTRFSATGALATAWSHCDPLANSAGPLKSGWRLAVNGKRQQGRDAEGQLRYEMASRLVVMGPGWLVFDGVILTPSIALPRHLLVMFLMLSLYRPHTIPPATVLLREGSSPGWHEMFRRLAGSLKSGGAARPARVQLSSRELYHAVFREIVIRRQSTNATLGWKLRSRQMGDVT